MRKFAPMRVPYRDEYSVDFISCLHDAYVISNLVYMKSHLTLVKYMCEWINEIYACTAPSSPPTGLFRTEMKFSPRYRIPRWRYDIFWWYHVNECIFFSNRIWIIRLLTVANQNLCRLQEVKRNHFSRKRKSESRGFLLNFFLSASLTAFSCGLLSKTSPPVGCG